ncbi:DUF3574 domain-containing protein [Phreatobacter aquaticus]|uniref:DUF3574 domain-containing protein n=1 Tax=Phreatobacter aquaticus TaxID=2570229 RepID=A0A4D7QM13_9HYPH|nr:DUF3574 domain-containing protein [Phreatobacter aquaticus]QCK86456.1 DUF3574 domain-containing protein [Phreatobacter aquaticus]
MRLWIWPLLGVLLAGCVITSDPECPPGGRPRLVAELLFGRNINDRLGVSEGDFRAFTDHEVTPRFPAGFTVTDARGQYCDSARGVIVREPSKVLMIVLEEPARDLPRLAEIAEAYKRRFSQQAVGIVTRRACAAF